MKVAVLGLGYVGTVTGAGLASQGHDVVGVDVDDMKVDSISAGKSPVSEPGIDQLVRDGVDAGLLRATTDTAVALDGADISLVCVGTPSSSRGDADLTYVSRALADIRDAMWSARPPSSGVHSVVIRSTVPPGTGRSVTAPAFAPELLPAGWSVGTAMCPEFLREGSGVADFFDPPFIVVGTDHPGTREALTNLFSFLGREVQHVDVPTAEGLKYACNAFHAVKIAFANEMGRVLSALEVDSRRVMEVFCEDHKLNIAPTYLRPGFAFGGSCLPKDLRAVQNMARVAGIDVPLISATTVSNEIVVRTLVDRVLATGYTRLCLLGLSFKSDTDDLRESPHVELAERLLGKGLDVRIFDPIVNPELLVGANRRYLLSKLAHVNRLLASSPEEALDGAEVVVAGSADPAVLRALTASSPRVVFDLDGRLGESVEQLPGYQGVSW